MIRKTPHNNKITYYLFAILFINIVVFIFSLVLVINKSKVKSENQTYDFLIASVTTIYYADPTQFTFDENNTAILKMDVLTKGIDVNGNHYYYSAYLYTDDFDQCAGYFIVTKDDKNIDVDTSHVCDMIDY
jgi:hypothetical protein